MDPEKDLEEIARRLDRAQEDLDRLAKDLEQRQKDINKEAGTGLEAMAPADEAGVGSDLPGRG